MPKTKGSRGSDTKLLTRLRLATALNYNPRTIQKLQDEGMPVAVIGRGGRPSQYNKADVQRWLAERNKAIDGEDGQLNFLQERAEKERWQGRLAKQQYLARQRELLPRDEVEKAWTAEVTAVRAKLMSWSTTLADRMHRVSTLEGLPGVERVFDEAVRDVLSELSEPPAAPAPAKSRRRGKKATAA